MFSGFWHGVFPSYYLSFFIVNLLITIEKKAYIKQIRYFPSFLFYMLLDSVVAVFKAFKWEMIKVVLVSLKYHLVIMIALYLWVTFTPFPKKTKTG